MSTKTQREFRKQMKELEKEGKLPNNYYAGRRRRVGVTSGISILFILYILWHFGILNMALSVIMSLFMGFGGYKDVVVEDNYQAFHGEQSVIMSYYDQISSTDYFMNDIYLKIYNQYILNKPVDSDFYTTSQEQLKEHLNNIKTDEIILQELYQSYKKELDTISDMLAFAVEHKDKTLSEQNKQYLNALIQQQQEINAKVLLLWDEIKR